MSALMTETAVLERHREFLKLPARSWIPNTTITVDRNSKPSSSSSSLSALTLSTQDVMERSSAMVVDPSLTTDLDAPPEGEIPLNMGKEEDEKNKNKKSGEDEVTPPPSPDQSKQSLTPPMASPQKWRKRANPSLPDYNPSSMAVEGIPSLITTSSDETSGWCDFYKQLAFTSTLTDIAERMRFHDPKDRSEELRKELTQLVCKVLCVCVCCSLSHLISPYLHFAIYC
jgi:hypothetical protein